jgi:hypothetical protein
MPSAMMPSAAMPSIAAVKSLNDGARPANRSFGPPAGSQQSSAPAAVAAGSAPSAATLLAASVRLTVEDVTGRSYGSGTLVDCQNGNALIVTCGHIFRDSQGKGKINVDVFGANRQAKVPAQLVGYDLKRDIGLVAIRISGPVTTIPLAPANYRVKAGDPVVSVGCDNGADPTVRPSKVTTLDKFLGPANLQVAGMPVQGRSGGGLFSADGFLIGVCNAADPTDNEGLFAAASTIHAQLDAAGLSSIYQRGSERGPAAASLAGSQMPARMPAAMPPGMSGIMPAAMPKSGVSAEAMAQATAIAGANDALRQLSPHERATLAELRQKAQGAEVICIVRSLNDPKAKSEIIVLDRASSGFLNQLAAERTTQDARHLTSLDVRSIPPAATPKRTAAPDASRAGGAADSRTWQPNWRSNP